MFDQFDPFKFSTWKRYLRIWLFIAKWLMRLLSANLELCLRHNFGRRYLPRLIASVFLYWLFVSLAPPPNALAGLFLPAMFVILVYHSTQMMTRQRRGTAEPYTLSTGDSWLCHYLKCSQSSVQGYVEPGLCFLVGLTLAGADRFLHCWLEASAVALFIKEQIYRSKLTRRILDSMDAKHEAQAMNAAMKAYQQPPAQRGQQTHRAHLPQRPQQPGQPHP